MFLDLRSYEVIGCYCQGKIPVNLFSATESVFLSLTNANSNAVGGDVKNCLGSLVIWFRTIVVKGSSEQLNFGDTDRRLKQITYRWRRIEAQCSAKH